MRPKKKKISSPNALADRFAKMRLTPSQTGNIKKASSSANRSKKQANNNKRRSPKISSSQHDKFAKRSGSEVIQPAIPYALYLWVKDAVDIMKHQKDQAALEVVEGNIDITCRFYRDVMPIGWKYDRENASSLIVGYDRIFRENCHTWIV